MNDELNTDTDEQREPDVVLDLTDQTDADIDSEDEDD